MGIDPRHARAECAESHSGGNASQRLSLYTLDDYVASQRVAEKAGWFTREGMPRNWDEHRGEPRDCVMFSLVPSDLES